MSAITPSAKSRLATSRLDAGCQAAQIGERRDVRGRAPIDRDSLVEFEIRLRKQRDGGAVRRNRRSRNDRVVATLRETLEDSVEVGARVAHRLQGEAELRTNCPHQVDVETARGPVVDEVE